MSHFNITVQPTNNENIVKFVANSFLTQARSFEFANIDEAKPSPLAQQLFHLPFVKTVYISQNFIAIEKYNIVAWETVQDEVATSIAEYLNSGAEVISEGEVSKKVPVTVYAESTPNPTAMKFVANKPLADGTFEFKNIDDAVDAPLAKALFTFPFVKEVFISSNYISVIKYNSVEWIEISNELRSFIREFIEEGKAIFSNDFLRKRADEIKISEEKNTDELAPLPTNNSAKNYDHSETEKEIISILDEYIKPAVASDGGHIAFDSYNPDSKTVKVILQGACSGCPSSTITLKNGIQTMMQEMLQGRVTTVEAING
ncbi:NifU family protein [Patiriisocius marinistellae]|uniref:NifU family protein n=1 Tax=Patiriisocius marinistellae TaxID=2494560 RepID=A0A5J4FU30_9FLAO|nr:NifU family protein [Patiriisocius marinistellae]GEQ84494.1 NifU family protein [Patiriisocius marinistellae]